MQVITFSKNVFIPLTNACRNACKYCGFRARSRNDAYLMKEREVISLFEKARKEKCKEALFTFGEKPESNEKIEREIKKLGYDSFLSYVRELCEKALSYGLLPHTNAGILSYDELKMLREVNASLGLMLENASKRLCERGYAHEHSPGKDPELRLRVIENAGKLKIPFTTGLLIGIGETEEEILLSLKKIKELSDRYNHIQEIIIQNFKPKKGTEMENFPEPSFEQMLFALEQAYNAFKDSNVALQIPPNLNKDSLLDYLKTGYISDLGGISTLTKDYINPEHEWQSIEELREILKANGYMLRERLPVYPKFISWLEPKVREVAEKYAGEDGLVKEGVFEEAKAYASS